jgi:hypothetical protein
MAGSCEYGDEPAGSGATELVLVRYKVTDFGDTYPASGMALRLIFSQVLKMRLILTLSKHCVSTTEDKKCQ